MSVIGTVTERGSSVPTQLEAISGVKTMWLRGEMICGVGMGMHLIMLDSRWSHDFCQMRMLACHDAENIHDLPCMHEILGP